MKKYLSYITLLAVCVPFLFSCEDNRNSGMVSDKVYLRKYGIQDIAAYALNKGEVKYDLWAYKGGNLASSGKVEFIIDPQLLVDYNLNHPQEEDLSVLPQECYMIPQSEFNVSGDNPAAKFHFSYDPDVLVNNYEAGRKYALPFRIKTSGIEVNEEKSFALVIFDINFMKMGFHEHPSQSREIKKGDALFNEKLTLVLPGDAPDDTNVKLICEESFVTAYNSEYGTNYKLLPAANYSFDNIEPTFPKGTNSMSVPFRVNVESLPAGEFMLPVAIASASGMDIDEERDVFYFIYLNSDEWFVTAADKENWSFVNASSIGPDGGTYLSKVIDGDSGSTAANYWGIGYNSAVLWDAQGLIPGKDQWVIIDLGAVINVGSVRLNFRANTSPTVRMRFFLSEEAPNSDAYVPACTPMTTGTFLYTGTYAISSSNGGVSIPDASKWTEGSDGLQNIAGTNKHECKFPIAVKGQYLMVLIPFCEKSLAIAEIDIKRIK